MSEQSTPYSFLLTVLHELAQAAACGAAYESWSDDFSRKECREVWNDSPASMRKPRARQVTVLDLATLSSAERLTLGIHHWDDKLDVLPLWMFNYIANGEVLTCIDGSKAAKGRDPIDLDVRGGCIAFGLLRAVLVS